MRDWKPERSVGVGADVDPAAGLPGKDPLAVAAALARDFAATAAARDKAGGTPKRERDALRASGLLKLVVPSAYGGQGRPWTEALRVVRTIAEADGSLGHVLGYHYLVASAPRLLGSEAQWQRHYRETAGRGLFWGNSFNPPRMDPLEPGRIAAAGVTARTDRGGYVLSGRNRYSSGAADSDMLVVSAVKAGAVRLTEGFLVAAVPTSRTGIEVLDDWDNFGQRQTDSSAVEFRDVLVAPEDAFETPGPFALPFATLRTCLAQATLAHVYLGIARGALAAGADFLRSEAKPYFLSGVERASQDPYALEKLGGLWADLEAASRFADAAAAEFQAAWDKGEALTAEERGALAVTIAGAKAAATRAGLRAAGEVFEALGASSTRGALGLDRFWRNLRTHTLHDPVSYKLRDLGAWLAGGGYPRPSFYS